MNVKDIIESGLLEAYVLGNATSEEAAQVTALCSQHPELQEEVERIERYHREPVPSEAPPPLFSPRSLFRD